MCYFGGRFKHGWPLVVFIILTLVLAGCTDKDRPSRDDPKSKTAGTEAETSGNNTQNFKDGLSALVVLSEPGIEFEPIKFLQEVNPGFELSDTGEETDDFGNTYAAGTIKNNTVKSYRSVCVRINFYNESETLVDNDVGVIRGLEAGGEAKFRVVNDRRASRFKVAAIEGYPDGSDSFLEEYLLDSEMVDLKASSQ